MSIKIWILGFWTLNLQQKKFLFILQKSKLIKYSFNLSFKKKLHELVSIDILLSINKMPNMSNDSLENLCGHIIITIYSASFNECLKYFLQTSILVTLIDFSMVIVTTIANIYLIYLLVKKKCTHLVFDRIFISHAFND